MSDNDEFTLADWMNAEKEEFSIDPAVIEKLCGLADQMMELATSSGIPIIIAMIEGSDKSSSNFVGSSNLAPMGRSPAEMLVCYSIVTLGLEKGYEVATQILLEMK